MFNFFSKVFENKKILVLVFLFLFISEIIIPTTAYAEEPPPVHVAEAVGCGIGIYAGAATGFWAGSFVPGYGNLAGLVLGAAGGILGCIIGGSSIDAFASDTAKDIYAALLKAIIDSLMWISGALAGYASGILQSLLDSTLLKMTITSGNGSFAMVWSVIRDLTNMLIVLGFVVIGIATALRFREYEAKKLLWPLILVALLVNFSGLLCGIIIDASNITMQDFLKKGGGQNVGVVLVSGINNIRNSITWNEMWKNSKYESYFSASIQLILVYTFTAYVIFYLAFLLIARQALLAVFFILSPLAFFCWVFPTTKKLWTMWWENFIKWAFIGLATAFFLWTAFQLLIQTKANLSSGTSRSLSLDILVTVVFLYICVRVTKTSSAMGASAVIGLATGAAGFAMGATKKVAGAVLEKAGRSNTGRAVREAVSNRWAGLQEATGFAKKGHVNDVKTKRREEHKNVAKGMTDDQVNNELTRTGGRGAKGAAFVEEATSRKILGKGRTHQQVAGLLTNAQEAGSPTMRKDAEKVVPGIAALNAPTVDRIQSQHPSWSPAPSPALGGLNRAQHEAVVRSVAKMPAEELDVGTMNDLHHSVITSAAARWSNRKKEEVRRNVLPDMAEQWHATPAGAEKEAIKHRYIALNQATRPPKKKP